MKRPTEYIARDNAKCEMVFHTKGMVIMAKYAVNHEGVRGLNVLASRLSDNAETIKRYQFFQYVLLVQLNETAGLVATDRRLY